MLLIQGKPNKTIFLLTLLLITFKIQAQHIFINEIMSDNEKTIIDQDSDPVDWIELYNNSDSLINLSGYYLSDDSTNLYKWAFPEVAVFPFQFLLIFASGKDKFEHGELHTNFKIASFGEQVFFSDSSGTIISTSPKVHLAIDESYGRFPNGSSHWMVMSVPTPEQSNNTSNQFSFSDTEGFYKHPFYLKITSLLTDTIYYTLDGSLPTDTSYIYTDSLLIKDKTFSPNLLCNIPTTPEDSLIWHHAFEKPSELIDKGFVLRCASYRNKVRTSKIYTKSFFIDSNIFEKYSLPVFSLVTDKNNLFHHDTGIYVPGVNYDETNPILSGNYFQRGEDWERLVHIEYFNTNGDLGFAQNAGIRIHGGTTRHAAQKSLRLYARREYGMQYFNYQILPDKDVSSYKRFILRSSMSGGTMIRDDIAQDVCKNLNVDYQDAQPVILFINGEYWGVHTVKDRIDERYIEYTHDVDKDSVEFKGWSNPDYNDLIEFISINDLSSDVNYSFIKNQIDIDNFIDYYISEIFFANYDWPANNQKCWKIKSEGRWRWVLYDLDMSFFEDNYNMFTHLTSTDSTVTWPNSLSSTFLFRNLIKNKQFMNQFFSRYIDVLNSDFCTNNVLQSFNRIVSLYEPELPKHINRWGYPLEFQSDRDDVFDFINNRIEFEVINISNFFGVQVFSNDFCLTDSVYLKQLIIYPNPSSGIFYINNNLLEPLQGILSITNISGSRLFNLGNLRLESGERKSFDVSQLPSGVYLLKLDNNIYRLLIFK